MIKKWGETPDNKDFNNSSIIKEMSKLIYENPERNEIRWEEYVYSEMDLIRSINPYEDRATHKILMYACKAIGIINKRVPVKIVKIEKGFPIKLIFHINPHLDNTLVKVVMYVDKDRMTTLNEVVDFWWRSFSHLFSSTHCLIHFTNQEPYPTTKNSNLDNIKMFKMFGDNVVLTDNKCLIGSFNCFNTESLHEMYIMGLAEMPNFGDLVIKNYNENKDNE